MGYVMQRDADKNGDVVETVKEEMTPEEQKKWEEDIKEHDEYMSLKWEENYQKCDITYLEGNNVIALKSVRVNVLKNLYRALDDKFIFVLTGDRCMVLNTNYIINIDVKGYESVGDIRRRNKSKFKLRNK